MKLDLNLLKFHSFKYDKKLHNLWKKEKIEVKEIIIKNLLIKKLKHVLSFEKFNNWLNDIKHTRSHNWENIYKEKLFYVIKTCHPQLYKDIEEKFLEKNKLLDLNVYQLDLSSRIRLVFIHSEEIIYPLILDLNHCFYSTKKNYDKNLNKGCKTEWDFKNEQQELKNNILTGLI